MSVNLMNTSYFPMMHLHLPKHEQSPIFGTVGRVHHPASLLNPQVSSDNNHTNKRRIHYNGNSLSDMGSDRIRPVNTSPTNQHQQNPIDDMSQASYPTLQKRADPIKYFRGSKGELVMVSSKPFPPYVSKRRPARRRVQVIQMETPTPRTTTIRRRLKTPTRETVVVTKFR